MLSKCCDAHMVGVTRSDLMVAFQLLNMLHNQHMKTPLLRAVAEQQNILV